MHEQHTKDTRKHEIAPYDPFHECLLSVCVLSIDNAAAAPAQAPASDSTAAAAAAAAATTVTTATIHTVPVTSLPLLTPPSVNVPEQRNAPSNIPAQVPPPASDHVEQVKFPIEAASPEPASQNPPPVEASLPTVVSASKVVSTVKQNEVPIQGGATQNKTTILDTPDGQTTTSTTDGNVLSTLPAPASSLNPSPSQTTNFHTNSKKDQVPLTGKQTSEKSPVQDTNPPSNKEPEECSDPTVHEVISRFPKPTSYLHFQLLVCCFTWFNLMFSLQTDQRTNTVGMPIKAKTTSIRTPQATPSPPAEVVNQCLPSVSQEYFSKPGILQVPYEGVVEQEELCSTTTSDLEISTSDPSTEPVQSVSLELPSAPLSSISESSDASNLNQPEEDHYESSFESHLGILTNVIHISEDPSVENLNGQPPSMLGNKLNPCGGSGNLQYSMGVSEDQPAQNYESTESGVYLRKPSGRDATRPSNQERSTSINYQAQESNATNLASNPNVHPREKGVNILHLTAAVAAVGIGLFVVWKIKH